MTTVVNIGSARIDEHGHVSGGVAGDQTGHEVSIQAWYKSPLGWDVIRAKEPIVRAKIAAAMRAACNNPKIGYDESQRDTLYNAAKPHGFDPGLVTVPCETDCSALVRVCCAFAGVLAPNFRTATEPAILKATGHFDILTDPVYTDHPDHLLEGDILCTRTSGHTVVVLNDGALAHPPVVPPKPTVPETYAVKVGDSLSEIAAKFGLNWHDLAMLNPSVKPPKYIIQPGQILKLK